MGEVDYWSPGGPEGISEPVHIGDRAHEKRHVDFPLRVLPRPMAQRAIGMDEVVLHVHYNQRRLTDVGSHCLYVHSEASFLI
jgi:hypothetical protein